MQSKTIMVSNHFLPASNIQRSIVENESCLVYAGYLNPESSMELFNQNYAFDPVEFQYYLYQFIEGTYKETDWYRKLFKKHFEDDDSHMLRLTIVYNNDKPHTDESTKMKVLITLHELCQLFNNGLLDINFNTVRPVIKNSRFLNIKTLEHLIFDKFYLDSGFTVDRLRYLYRLVTKPL